jgi:hypothetical protein
MNRSIVIVLMLLMLAVPCRGESIVIVQSDFTGVTLTTPAGEPFVADQIGKEQRVLVVLISKGNPGGIKLLDFLASRKPGFPAERLLIVVSDADERVFSAISAKYPQLGATWYRDQKNTLAKKLQLGVTPAILGVFGANVAWNLFGISDAKLLDKTMRGWLTP